MQRFSNESAKEADVLIDVTHPAHVLRYLPLAAALAPCSVRLMFVGRDREITRHLLDASDVPLHIPRSLPFPTWAPNVLMLALELTRRTFQLARIIRAQKVRLVLTSNPTGCIAAWLLRVPVIFDTNDGRDAGLHHYLAAPFATIITSPSSLKDDFGGNHLKYRSYKSLAWLHPDRFGPRELPPEMSQHPGRPIVVLRAVAHRASHDRGISGFTEGQLLDLVERIGASGADPIISMEAETSLMTTSEILKRRPELLSSILAVSSLVISDGASVVEEAAVLGVPAIRLSTPRGERDYLWDLERRYGLVTNVRVGDDARFTEVVSDHLSRLNTLRADFQQPHKQLLDEHHDGVQWYVDLVSRILSSKTKNRKQLVDELRHAGLDERTPA